MKISNFVGYKHAYRKKKDVLAKFRYDMLPLIFALNAIRKQNKNKNPNIIMCF